MKHTPESAKTNLSNLPDIPDILEHHHFVDGIFRGKGSGDPCKRCILEQAAPDMLEALKYADELVKVARKYFPKSIHNSDKFQLENTCAAIGKAIVKAEA